MYLPHVSVEPKTEQSLIIEMEENLNVLPSLLSDDMDIKTIEAFRNSQLGGTNKKVVHFDQLRDWQSTDINKRRLSDFCHLAS